MSSAKKCYNREHFRFGACSSNVAEQPGGACRSSWFQHLIAAEIGMYQGTGNIPTGKSELFPSAQP
jgi:hypothetical protein